MKTINSIPLLNCLYHSQKPTYKVQFLRTAATLRAMSTFPPEKVRGIVGEVAALLKERKESVSVAETVCFFFVFY
jgi:hypothetical protein